MSNKKEFKGTQGEWSHSEQSGFKNRCIQAQVWNPKGTILALIEPTWPTIESNANAKLIAAAPDLLQALQEIKERVDQCKNAPLVSINETFDSYYQKVLEDAINKAL